MKKIFVLVFAALFLVSCSAVPEEIPGKISEENIESSLENVFEEKTSYEKKDVPETEENEKVEVIEENPDTSPKEEPVTDFKKFTASYYLKTEVPDETFYTLNPILEGRTVDFEKITLLYRLKDDYGNLNEKEQFEAFLKDYYKTGKLQDMYVAAGNSYFATAFYGEDEAVGITLSMDGKYSVGQIGGIPDYLFPETEEINRELSKIFGSEKVNASFVSLTVYLDGILLSSETKEYMIVKGATWDFAEFFEIGKIYPVSEVIAEIEKLESLIVE